MLHSRACVGALAGLLACGGIGLATGPAASATRAVPATAQTTADVVADGTSSRVDSIVALTHTSAGMVFAGRNGYYVVSDSGAATRFNAPAGLSFRACEDLAASPFRNTRTMVWRNVVTGHTGVREVSAGRTYVGPSATGWLETAAGTDGSGRATRELHQVDAETGADTALFTAVGTTDPASRPSIPFSGVCDAEGYGVLVQYTDHTDVVAGAFTGGHRVVASEPVGQFSGVAILGVAGDEVTFGRSDYLIQKDVTRVNAAGQRLTWLTTSGVRVAAAMIPGATVSLTRLSGGHHTDVYLKPAAGNEVELSPLRGDTSLPNSSVTVVAGGADRVLVGRSGAEAAGLFSVTADGTVTQLWSPPQSRLQVSNLASGPGRLAWSDDRDSGASVRSRSVGQDGSLGPETTVATELSLDSWAEGLDATDSRVAIDGRRIGWVEDDAFVVDDGVTRLRLPDYRPVLTAMSGHRIVEGSANANTSATVTDVATGATTYRSYVMTMSGQTGIYTPAPSKRSINVTDVATGTITTQNFVPPLPVGLSIAGVAIAGDIFAWRWTEQVNGHLVAHVGWANRRTRTTGELPVRLDAEAISLEAHGLLVGATYRAAAGDMAVVFDTSSGTVKKELPEASRLALGASGVAWVDELSGTAFVAPLPVPSQPPMYEGNPLVQATFSALDGKPWTGELAFSEPLLHCTVEVTHSSGGVVRALPCDPAAMAQGEAVVSWDGRDSSARYATTGTYVWTAHASGAGGAAVAPAWPTSTQSGTISVTDDRYTAVTPTRLVDTRSALGAPAGPVTGGQEIAVQVAGRGSIPASGVDSVLLNVAAVTPTSGGYATLYPSGTARPNASNLNYARGASVSNQVLAKVGADGMVRVFTSATSHLLVDVAGYYPTLANVVAMTPSRLLDTRTTARIPAGKSVDVTVTGRAGVPSVGVGAVALNITAVKPSAGGFITVWPTGAVRPTASNLNFVQAQTMAGLAVTKVGANGKVSIYASASSDVLVDLAGWMPTGSDLQSVTPSRVLDTRTGLNTTAGRVPVGGTVDVVVLGRGGVPANRVKAVVVNVTTTGSTAGGYVTAWPAGAPRPTVSMLNHAAGQTIANSGVIKVGDNGRISLYLSGGGHAIVDVQGYVMW